ncbi:MAG: SMP-30/gluconolactonase/LRE family protein [Lentisphaeria bacterium]|nr:SMP-30/gluconolactonase/LRE family protein [Lentisphaeria bacterium]NQZ68144.1 SMP-30/gluconolactonase/LRE family protein [Lentisphaeria bacterium]
MILGPDDVEFLGDFKLDHPEGLCVADDGTVFCGGEAGQIYRIETDGTWKEFANTGGFILGMALDGQGNLHCCDMGLNSVVKIDMDGVVTDRAGGAPGDDFLVPNYPAFDAAGNLYVSSSGDYWDETGTGKIMRIAPDNTCDVFHDGPFRFTNGVAVDPASEYLYVIQSSIGNVVRIPLSEPNGEMEVIWDLPENVVPDGLAICDDGSMVISCYRPDIVYLGKPDGTVEVLVEDVTAELLMRPTNCALHDGKLYLANLGGWHICVLNTDLKAAPLHKPSL